MSKQKEEKIYAVTSESVTEGHPDKICDQISDAILDDLISRDPESHVAIECLVTRGTVIVAGEVTTKEWANIPKIVRQTLKDIGYTNPKFGMDYGDAGVLISIHSQSPDINQGVAEKEDKEQGAGDQGMMCGYACDETWELMPLPIILAHKLTMKMAELRKTGKIKGIGPDGKSQVTVLYRNDKPIKVTAIVIAQQHLESKSPDVLAKEIIEKAIKPVCGMYLTEETKIFINATGRFVIGGPEGDTGVTGRKIVVDTYGGIAEVGGGAFSGKDPSKVDRSGAYMARYAAKNIVAAGLAKKCKIWVSYCIGIARPTSVSVNCYGTEKVPEEKITEAVLRVFDFRPKAIITNLRLKRPIYKKTAAYGHFGRNDPDFTWEKTDKVEALKKALEL